jgi:hypothetical protein
MNASTIVGAAVRGKLVWVGVSLIAVVGLVHLIAVPEYFEFATYLGLLFAANVLGAVVSAIGIYRGARWGWPLGVLVAGGAFVMYVVSRTIGLPGLPEGEREWLDPPGILSLIVEGLFVGIYMVVSVVEARKRTSVEPS